MTRRLFLFLLLCLPLMGQTTLSNVYVQNVTFGAGAPATQAAADWSEYFLALWDMEGASDNPEPNDGNSTTGCGNSGADCDVDETAAKTIASVTGVHGNARQFVDADIEELTCDNSTTCEELNLSADADFSLVAWYRYDGSVQANDAYIINNLSTVVDGYRLYIESGTTPDALRFTFGDGTLGRSTDVAITGEPQADTWYHVAFTHDNGTGQVGYVKTGAGTTLTNTGSNTQGYDPNSSPAGFDITTVTSNRQDASLDEVAIYSGVLSANAICRVCACGVDGSACTHNGSVWTDIGVSATNCGGCLGTVDVSTTCVGDTSPADCT